MLLGVTSQSHRLTYTGVSPSTPGLSSPLPLQRWFLTLCRSGRTSVTAPQPLKRNACRLSHALGLASSDFARHYSRNHFCFLFLWVLRCFTSPRSLYPPYIFRRESSGRTSTPDGVSPFGKPRITARLPTSRGLSQAPTSFIGSWCQGIHHVPLVACRSLLKMLASTV